MQTNLKLARLKYIVMITAMLSVLSSKTIAQPDILSESQKIQDAYKKAAYLSFDMRYTYAFENEPSVVEDSSLGNFRISGSRYWGTIDSAEFMQNDSFAIVVYRPGKLIHVSRPRNVYPQLTGFASLDSFVGKEGYTYSFTTKGESTTLALTFTDQSSPYKRFSLTYSPVTYQVKEMAFVIKEEYLSGEGSVGYGAAEETSGKYMLVKAAYDNYSSTAFDSTVFDVGNYFSNKEGLYVPAPQFNAYEIFLSSPDISSTQKPVRK